MSLYLVASSACFNKFLSWFSICFIISSAFFKLFSAAVSLSSASCLLTCRPPIPAASSKIALRSVGFAVTKDPTLPWLTIEGEWGPVERSAKRICTSFALTSLPFKKYFEPLSFSIFLFTSISGMSLN